MSYTLDILKGAKEALLNGDQLACMKRLNILIDRHEQIIKLRKNWNKAERIKNATDSKAKGGTS